MKQLKISIHYLFAAAAVLLFISCGTNRKKQDNLTFMTWGDVYNRPFFESLARQYNKTNPKVKVEIFAPSGAYFDRLVTMAAGSALCDLTLLAGTQYDLLAYKDQLIPLNDIITNQKFKPIMRHIFPNTVADGMRNGKLYAMPIWTWAGNWYYNKTLLQKFGIGELPGKWNWNDFLNICRKVTRRETITERTFGTPMLTGSHNILHDIMLKQNGLSMFTEDMQKCIINSPQQMSVYKYLFDLTLRHRVSVTKSDSESITSETRGISGVFGSGMVAFHLGGREQADIMHKAKLSFNWDVAGMPTDAADAVVTSTAYAGIAKTSKKIEAALEFLRWIAGEQGQRMITLRRMDIAVYKPLTYSSEFENMLDMKKMNILYRESIEHALPADPVFPRLQEFRDIQKLKYELVNEGKYELRAALNEIAAAYDNLKE